jgi:hypothetical protein
MSPFAPPVNPAAPSFLGRPASKSATRSALALLALSLASCTVAPDGHPGSQTSRSELPTQIVDRMDVVVSFTRQQRAQVIGILKNELATQRAGSSEVPRTLQLGPEVLAQIRTLLTPEQQVRFDANPTGIPDLAVQAYVTNLIASSPGITKRVGQIQAVKLVHHQLILYGIYEPVGAGPNVDEGFGLTIDGEPRDPIYQHPLIDPESGQLAGIYIYQVTGSLASERFWVRWERASLTAKVKILDITGRSSGAIKL